MHSSVNSFTWNRSFLRSRWRTGLVVLISSGIIAATLMGLAGCGGGGSNGKAVTPAQRTAALDAISAAFKAMPHSDTAAENTQVAALIAARPEFEASGVSTDGCAWGRFTDGRVLVVVNNRKGTITKSVPYPQPPRRSRAAGAGLPAQVVAHLFDSLGTYFSHPARAFLATVAAHGYQVLSGTVKTGTVEDLKAVQGDGLFYLDAHGGSCNDRSGKSVYSVWTGTQVTTTLDATYAPDLDSNKLVYMIATTTYDPAEPSKPFTEKHYAITPAFVTAYMHFGANSLVYNNACSSDNATFKGACITAGAGVYLGWTAPVGDLSAYGAATFLFDRILGDNTLAPTDNPAKPPLDWTELQSAMANTTNPDTSLPYGTAPADSTHPASILKFTAGLGDLGVLVPSIHSGTVDTVKGEATLTGEFGATLGTAEVYGTGTALLVKSWTRTQVVLAVTPDVSKIILRVNGRPSNSFSFISVALTPATANVTASAAVSLSAAVVGEAAGTAISYHWQVTGGSGTLTSGSQTGTAFDSDSSSVQYTANDTAVTGAVDTVTVQAFTGASTDPNRKLIGPATAQITIADLAFGDVSLTITGSSYPLSALKNPARVRVMNQQIGQLPPGTNGRYIVDSLHNVPHLFDAVNTYLDFTTAGPSVGQVVDISQKVFSRPQIEIDLETAGGGVGKVYSVSGTLTVLETNYPASPTYIRFTSTGHYAYPGGASLDATITGWIAGLYTP